MCADSPFGHGGDCPPCHRTHTHTHNHTVPIKSVRPLEKKAKNHILHVSNVPSRASACNNKKCE